MSRKNCDLMNDLLPLYAEGICSEESRKLVTEHLADCPACSEALRKMGTELHVAADRDIAVMKKIRRRIRIAKAGVGILVGIVVLIALWLAVFHLLNTPEEMDYTRYGLAESVTVEADEAGGLWLVRTGLATAADGVELYPDGEGGIGCTLMQHKIDRFAYADLTGSYTERILICNINDEAVQRVYYREEKSGTEHILWQRNGA